MKNSIERLLEATDAFNKYISESEINKAIEAYGDLKDRSTQLLVLQDAKDGDLGAVNLLYYLYKGLTAKAFWTYYLGPDKKYWPARLRAGEDYDFASRAYELLASGSEGKTSPYTTFNAQSFDMKTDLIKKFGYYFFRYLQNEAFKMIRQKKHQGLTGNISQTAPIEVASYEDVYDNSVEASPVEEDLDLKITLDDFTDSLSTRYKKVFSLKRQGYPVNDIAEKLGVAHGSIRNYLKDIKELWDAYSE